MNVRKRTLADQRPVLCVQIYSLLGQFQWKKSSNLLWFCWTMLFDFFETSAWQRNICPFRPKVMSHTCWYVYNSATRFFTYIITGTTNGSDCIDAKSRTSKNFLDLCGFMGDYPAQSQVIDGMGHTTGAPSTRHSFQYRSCKNSPKYAYLT